MKIGIAIFLTPLFLITGINSASAQDGLAVKYLKKDDKAPFSGMLLSDEAAVENKVRFQTIEKLHINELSHMAALLNAEHKADVDKLNIILEREREIHALEIDTREREIDFLTNQLEPKGFFNSFNGGFVIGVSGTVIIIVVTAYALHAVSIN